MKNRPHQCAIEDMREYFQSHNISTSQCDNGDIWNVSPSSVFNKESRRLNKELGLNSVNKKRN